MGDAAGRGEALLYMLGWKQGIFTWPALFFLPDKRVGQADGIGGTSGAPGIVQDKYCFETQEAIPLAFLMQVRWLQSMLKPGRMFLRCRKTSRTCAVQYSALQTSAWSPLGPDHEKQRKTLLRHPKYLGGNGQSPTGQHAPACFILPW
ncbi:hypothetical protein O181_000049 [Austropuccinia psidii MF-1]|uniref:Uncharacterized protein n=1 Tax=Austropuccinia psidii MF-1 TaxID=1389203 RepID=A0A9Q3B7X5_9BASI|nr:hypothetical protein [Austropuccinia psidii MF-1]